MPNELYLSPQIKNYIVEGFFSDQNEHLHSLFWFPTICAIFYKFSTQSM